MKRNAIRLILAVALAGLGWSFAQTKTPPPPRASKKTAASRKVQDAKLAEILRLNKELVAQHEAFQRANDDKIRRLTELLREYERRLAADNMGGSQERLNRNVAESEFAVQVRALESQVQRLEQQVRDLETRLQQSQQMLDAKQREVQQLEDRLRLQTVR